MSCQPRHLIISSDISTWKFDQPVLFLGKWCLREQDKSIWEKMDAVVAEPVGADNFDRYSLHLIARGIEFKLFPRVVKILNQYHGVDHNDRYWKIIIGHWFRETVQLLLNRIVTVERCMDQHQISSVTLYSPSNVILAAKDYGDIWKLAMDNYWNAEIFERILVLSKAKSVLIERVKHNTKNDYKVVESDFKDGERSSSLELYKEFRRVVDRSTRKFAAVLSKETDAVVINSYLPPDKELLLSIALGQFPQRRTGVHYVVKENADLNIRRKLGQQMEEVSDSNLESMIASFVFDLIPVSSLEGYENLVTASKLTEWPEKPKFIFTSNNFVSDEIFKVWTAEKVNQGIPYIVGQHGNRYGTHKLNELTIEEITSDRFLTWGWKRGLAQHTPAFIFKNVGTPKKRKSQEAGLILLEDNPTARFEVWEQADELVKHMEEQFRFVSHLARDARNDLVVRLHPSYQIMQSEGDIRWKNFDQKIKLDLGRTPIRELWFNNKLIVHGYDSTGILETLEANRPTLAFWQNGLNHLVDEALPYYEVLINVGIVHLTPESTAKKVNEIWTDVENWWLSMEVQNARKTFCQEYARTSKKPIRDLKKLLLKEI